MMKPGAITGILIFLALSLYPFAGRSQSGAASISGTVLDPSGRPIAGALVHITASSGKLADVTTGSDGTFVALVAGSGAYTVSASAAGFAPVSRRVEVRQSRATVDFQLDTITSSPVQVVVTGVANDVELTAPDPSQRVMVREELLDANPGRPGAPVSLPGLPIETASGGIKAPQYFVPGVAGDHGEPIAQYLAVGGFLVPNNLSANAHGNGYADPNIFIPAVLAGVTTDGGAFNVLEGNHALNLAAIYSVRPRLMPFVTFSGDAHDIDVAAGFARAAKPEWIALEAAYGDGLLERPERRQQYKWNATRVIDAGEHDLTLFLLSYYGSSYLDGLVPLGMGEALGDTIDARQRDQTHTAIVAADDRWNAGTKDEFSFSGFFRTYNLALDSNFGEGLIRQSEFRTAGGTEARTTHTFRPWLRAMAGVSYNDDRPRRDNLDHYLSGDAAVYGPFVQVLANNVGICDVAPYVALQGNLGRQIRFYGGLRHDQIRLNNYDLINPSESFDQWRGLESPKATVAWTPGGGPAHWLPYVSFSIGQGFFTEDPRIGLNRPDGEAASASLLERSHSEQVVLEKEFSATDVRITLGRTTTTATLAKIDPDIGLPENLGPGELKYLTASVRHQFSFGSVQGVASKADARDQSTGLVTPEAPRTILDGLAAMDRLPFGLRARGEYEYVGRKLLDVGGFEAVPVKELRMAVVRPLRNGRVEVGVNGMLARGYTGQTTEMFAPDWQPGGAPPACPAGIGGTPSDFDCGTMEKSVGVRLLSFVGASVSYRFGAER
jgi:hypothetical protein